jgi:hypothetical protein
LKIIKNLNVVFYFVFQVYHFTWFVHLQVR